MKKTPKISKEVLALRRTKAYRKAYTDDDFMSRRELRPVRLQLELLKPELALVEHDIKTTVVVFGSARTRSEEQTAARERELLGLLKQSPEDPALRSRLAAVRSLRPSARYYEIAREFAKIVSCNDCAPGRKLVVVTGGGPGIMEAANRGAHEGGAQTVGLNITLPHEQHANPYVTPSLSFKFHYFALRKMHFMMRAKALVAFPGGFGTLDELFEIITLVQTQKSKAVPIILFGEEYWRRLINLDVIVEEGVVSPEDLKLFQFLDDPQKAWDAIRQFYDL